MRSKSLKVKTSYRKQRKVRDGYKIKPLAAEALIYQTNVHQNNERMPISITDFHFLKSI